MSGAVETAIEAWGDTLPDWVRRLAEECEGSSQVKAARRLGRSASMVNQILRNRYKADLSAAEEMVRGRLMAQTVPCPGFGDELPTNDCQMWRKRALDFSGHNQQRVTMFRACTRCEIFKKSAQGRAFGQDDTQQEEANDE